MRGGRITRDELYDWADKVYERKFKGENAYVGMEGYEETFVVPADRHLYENIVDRIQSNNYVIEE